MINRRIIFTHVVVAAFASIILYLVYKPLVRGTDSLLIADAAVAGILFSVLLVLLRYIIRYSHFFTLEFGQRLVNYLALGILFVACWVGLGYLIIYLLFPGGGYELFLPLLPIRVILSMIVYCLLVSVYSSQALWQYETDADSEDTLLDNNIGNESTSQQDSLPEDNDNKQVIERIAVKNGQKIDVVLVPEIVYLQAEGDYVMIHSTKGKFLKEQTMKSFEEILPSTQFVRVHRSNIVNVEFVSQIELYDKQYYLLTLKGGVQIRISASGYRALKKVLGL